jgi:hypothetical protein
MMPEISTLTERIAAGGDWMEFRIQIAELHDKATTQEEYVELLHAHSILGLLINDVYDEKTAEKIRAIHSAEYINFLNKEATENGDLINPALLALITAREVEAGRMDPNDEFRKLAQAGGQVLGDSAYLDVKPNRKGNWVTLAFSVLAIILWAASIRLLDISALWLILVGFVLGWFINEREVKEIRRKVKLAGERKGY